MSDFDKLTSRIEELLSSKKDESWGQWSQYILKAIEDLNKAIININISREITQVDVAGLKTAVVGIENAVKDFSDYKEKIIAPLRIKVAIMAVVGGFFGGIFAACIPTIIRYFLQITP